MSYRMLVAKCTFMLVLLLCTTAFAQVGESDTVRVMKGELVVGQSRPVQVELYNDEVIWAASIVTKLVNYGSGEATFDSVRFVGRCADPTVLPLRAFYSTYADGAAPDIYSAILYSTGQNELLEGDAPIMELWFTGTEPGSIEFLSWITPNGGYSHLYTYPRDPITEAGLVWRSKPISIMDAADIPQIQLPATPRNLIAGDSVEIEAPIVSGFSPEELTTTADMYAADNDAITPTNAPLITGTDPLTIAWNSTDADIGVWTLHIQTCTPGGVCSDASAVVQVVESSRYLVELSESKTEAAARATSFLKGQFDSDPTPELLLSGNGDLYTNSIEIYDASGLGLESGVLPDQSLSGAVAAYLDSDYNLDLVNAVFKYSRHFLQSHIGNGADGFTDLPTTQTVGLARGAAAAEVNGDQYIDYLAAADSSIVLFTGHGDGTFTKIDSISLSDKALTLNVADFNLDDAADLAVGTPNGVEIYLGDGTGQFTYETTYPQSYGATDIEVTNQGSDFNKDDIYDLCVSTPSVGGQFSDIVVYLGNGDGTFQPVDVRQVKGQVLGNAVGDINLDGNVDICYINGSNKYVGVLFGDGAGNFPDEVRYPTPDGFPTHLLLCDRELDGDLDIAVTLAGKLNADPSYLEILTNPLNPAGMIAGNFEVRLEGKASLDITSPSGNVLNFVKNSFPSASLYNHTNDDDDVIDEYAKIDVIESGSYTVSINPRANADAGDRFSLAYRVNDRDYTLVDNQPLVADGYQFVVFPSGDANISPFPGQVLPVGTIELSWPDAGAVELQIAHDPSFSDLVLDTEVDGNSYDYAASVSGPDDTTTCYWRLLPAGQTSLGDESGKIGVFHVTGIITDVNDNDGRSLPVSFRLGQNHPNPFNPSTTIEFDIAKRSFVTLEISNVVGQKVRTLVSQQMTAGSHQVIWLGRNDAGQKVASGIYFYRLKSGDNTAVRKMIMLK